MKVGDTIEAIADSTFNGVVLVKKGEIDECIEIGDISHISPMHEGTYIKISSLPEKYCNIKKFRVIEFPPSLESEIKEALQAPVIEIINV